MGITLSVEGRGGGSGSALADGPHSRAATATASAAVDRLLTQLGAQQPFAWPTGDVANVVSTKLVSNLLAKGRIQQIWLSVSDSVDVNEIKKNLLPKLFGNAPPAEISDDPDLFVRVFFKDPLEASQRLRIFEPIPGQAGVRPDCNGALSFGEHLQTNIFKDDSVPTSSSHRRLMRELGSLSDFQLTDKLTELAYPNLKLVNSGKNAEAHTAQSMLHHPNLMPAMMILESDDSFFVVGPHYQFSLADMLRFRQGGLTQSVTRRLFVVYQLLKVVEHLHSKGLTLGGSKTLHRDSVFMDELLWLRVMPSSVIAPSPPASLVRRQTPFYSTPKLDHPTDRWIRGDISNFEYLLYVNHAAGRRSGNPVFHPAMPWVIEFVAQRLEDEVFRDMTRTKFRLNKGDEQLDITYDSSVPHHITDILTDITYYVYLARRTPIPHLRRHVRTKYEPNEYPKDMRRLYQWTPDECIPEFFTDATMFSSMHSDMPDLLVPAWASSPEDFISKHRQLLESDRVSMTLHHWIDLMFGYKLSGRYAVEAKNVPLSTSDGGVGGKPLKHGIIQLFREPHPAKLVTIIKGEPLPTISTNAPVSLDGPTSDAGGAAFVDRVTSFLLTPLSSSKRGQHQQPQLQGGLSPSTPTAPRAASNASDQQHSVSGVTEQEPTSILLSSTDVVPMDVILSRSHDVTPTTASSAIVDQYTRVNLKSVGTRRYVFNAFAPVDPILQQQSEAPSSGPFLGVLGGGGGGGGGGSGGGGPSSSTSVSATSSSGNPAASSGSTGFDWSASQSADKWHPASGVLPHGALVQATLAHLAAPATLIPLTSRGIDPDMFLGPLMRLESAQGFASHHAQLLRPAEPPTPPSSVPSDMQFEEACAIDMFALGQLIEALFAEDPTESSVSAVPLQKIHKGHALPSMRMPVGLQQLVQQLKHPQWYRRPKAADIVHNVVPDSRTNVFANSIVVAYEYMSRFVMAGSWSARLDLAKREMQEICSLPNETFELVLPTLLLLFKRPETKVAALTLVDRLGSRLGPHKTRLYLLKPFLALFETQRDDVYRQLLKPSILDHLMSRFGMREIVKQLVPFLLEGLVVDPPAGDDVPLKQSLNAPPQNMVPVDLDENGVASFASRLVLTVAGLIGPILTAKYISVPLLRRLFTEAGSSAILLQTLSALGSYFGETFIIMHYFPALMGTLESHINKPLGKTAVVIVNVISLVEKLVLQIPAVSLVGLINGQLGNLLRSLLSPLPKQSRLDGAGRGTICKKAIGLLVFISHSISRVHWEKRVLPILQGYFTPFNDIYGQPTQLATAMAANLGASPPLSSLHDASAIVSESERTLVIVQAAEEEQPLYTEEMAHFAYFQFCQLIGQETMRRYIPNSDLIEKLMYQHLTSTAAPGSTIEANLVVASANESSFAIPDIEATSRQAEIDNDKAVERLVQQDRDLLQEGEIDEEGSVNSNDADNNNDRTDLEEDGLMQLSYDEQPITPAPGRSRAPTESGDDLYENIEYGVEDSTISLSTSPAASSIFSFASKAPSSATEMSIASASTFASTAAVAAAMTAAAAAAATTSAPPVPSPSKPVSRNESTRSNYSMTAPIPLSKNVSSSVAAAAAAASSTTTTSTSTTSAAVPTKRLGFPSTTPFWKSKASSTPTPKGDDVQPWKEYFSAQTDLNNFAMPMSFHESKLKVYTGHTNTIKSMTVNSSERLALTSSKDKTVKLWSLGIQRTVMAAGEGSALNMGECLRTYTGHKRSVFDAMFVHGGRQVLSCDGHFHLWEVESCRLIYHVDLSKSNIVSVGHMPRLAHVVAASANGSLQFIDYRTRNLKQAWRVPHNVPGQTRVTAVDPINNELIALGTSAGVISLIDARTGMILSTWKAHDGEVSQLSFVEGDSLVSAGTDGSMFQWDVTKVVLKSSFKGVGDIAALHSSQENIYAINSTNTLHMFGMDKSVLQAPQSYNLRQGSLKNAITAAVALPLHQLVLFGCDDGQIVLYS